MNRDEIRDFPVLFAINKIYISLVLLKPIKRGIVFTF